MTERRSFYRKIGYICAIALLLLPLYALSAPGILNEQYPERQRQSGGKLAQLRSDHGLSQANLGEIDPASETIKLATLGMRGVAANILWGKANHYKKTEDWSNLSATLEQITKLQPNFISVWQFQAWNLSYNVSSEFDDYRQRYHWVISGIKFLQEGEKYNKNDPRLLWDIGWFLGQKIGRADEHKQFRELFRNDDEFHSDQRVGEQRDNWLVGKEWFQKANTAVDSGKPLKRNGKGKSELIFFSDVPMSQINYSDAIEKEGVFSEVAREAWKKAGENWNEYGSRELPTVEGLRVRLNDKEGLEKEVEKVRENLEELMPGLREKMIVERRDQLTEEQLKALKTPPAERSDEQYMLAAESSQKMKVTHREVANRIAETDPKRGAQAKRLAEKLKKDEERVRSLSSYRQIVNFDYWRTRCEFEQMADALDARRKVYQADQELTKARLVPAKKLYEEGFSKWRRVLDTYPEIVDDTTTGDDLMEVVKNYQQVLDELDEEFPRDFVLWDIVEKHDRQGTLRQLLETSPRPSAEENTAG